MDLPNIIDKAREIVGSIVDNSVAERYVPDEAIVPLMASNVRRLTTRLRVSSAARRVRYTCTSDAQEIPLNAIALDVGQVTDVLRSSQFITDGSAIAGSRCRYGDPTTARYDDDRGGGAGYVGHIDHFLQQNVADKLAAIGRRDHVDRFDYEVYTAPGNVRTLVLMPPPFLGETIQVEYAASDASVEGLPAIAEPAAVYAACAAICDAQLNRISSQDVDRMPTMDNSLQSTGATRADTLRRQRDYYEQKFNAEISDLKGQ